MKHIPSIIVVLLIVVLDGVYVGWVLTSEGQAGPKLLCGAVLAIVNAITVLILSRWLAASAKGQLLLHVDLAPRLLGSEVSGAVEVTAKRDLDVTSLTVAVVARAELTDVDGSRVFFEIWRAEDHPIQAMTLNAGSQMFSFSFDLPDHLEPEADPDRAMDIGTQPVHWWLLADLAVRGVDLSARQRLEVPDGERR